MNTQLLLFYSEMSISLLLFATLIVSIRYRKRHPKLRRFPFYIGFLLILYIGGTFSEAISLYHSRVVSKKISAALTLPDYVFTILELFVFFDYFINTIRSGIVKKALTALIIIFSFYYTYSLINEKGFPTVISESTQSKMYTIESIILFFPCIVYYWELFRFKAVITLKDDSDFWIITGLFFFISMTLPFSVIENYLRKVNFKLMITLYTIFYISYALNFIMVIKAYYCKPSINENTIYTKS